MHICNTPGLLQRMRAVPSESLNCVLNIPRDSDYDMTLLYFSTIVLFLAIYVILGEGNLVIQHLLLLTLLPWLDGLDLLEVILTITFHQILLISNV